MTTPTLYDMPVSNNGARCRIIIYKKVRRRLQGNNLAGKRKNPEWHIRRLMPSRI